MGCDTTAAPLLAWHGDPELKAAAVARMRAHREADEFIQGLYLDVAPGDSSDYRGCFHGCLTAEAVAAERGITLYRLSAECRVPGWSWWVETERLFGIPRRLCLVLDSTFEGCYDSDEAGRFAVEVTEAIPVGADLSGVAEAILGETGDDEYYDPDRIVELLRAAPVPQPAAG